MKKTITLSIAAILCVAISTKAQINKGSVMLGGTIGGNFNNVKNPDTVSSRLNSISIQPAIGFAIDTNTILGFSLLYGMNNNKYYSYDQKFQSYGAGLFLRKYKLLSKNFYLFGEGGLMYYHNSYNYASQNNNGNEYDSKSNAVNLYISPGIAYSLTRCIQLEAGLQNLLSIGYSSTTENAKVAGNQDYKINNFQFGSSLNPVSFNGVFIGLRFLIRK